MSVSDMKRPKATPRVIDTVKVTKKIPIPWKMEEMYISLWSNLLRVLFWKGSIINARYEWWQEKELTHT